MFALTSLTIESSNSVGGVKEEFGFQLVLGTGYTRMSRTFTRIIILRLT